MEGYQKVVVRSMGMNLVLLSSEMKEGVNEAVKSNEGWWRKWFSEIIPWNSNLYPRGRRIWARLI
ncbi:hypothetical protein A2U01_0094359, partial [Trifolium medium]|nr:hypothetical protein [Trifolium medium]